VLISELINERFGMVKAYIRYFFPFASSGQNICTTFEEVVDKFEAAI